MTERLRFPDTPIIAATRGDPTARRRPELEPGEQLCPACGGDRVTMAITCPPGQVVELACSLCTAEGKIDAERAIAIVEGQRMRRARLDRGLSQRQRADELGMDRVAYSKLEQGIR